jgi:tetratricopeptide (TPR) repeat protein
MKRAFVFALLLGALAFAQDKSPITFRLKKDPKAPMRGWCLKYDDQGFTFEAFGTGKRVEIRWDELVDEDARKHRVRFKLEMTEDERLGLIPGHEIFFRGGGSRMGVLDRHDKKEKVYWLRHDGMVLAYPEDRVDRTEETKVKEADVYSEEEVYVRRLERTPPQNAREHNALADYMYDIGNWSKADEHYRAAIADDENLRPRLEARLGEIKGFIEDEVAGKFFRKAKSMANLRGEYDKAVGMIEEYIAEYEGAKRRGLLVIEEIKERRHQKMIAVFHRTKDRALNNVIRNYISRKQPDIQEAMSWATSKLEKEMETYIRNRMGLSEEEYEAFLKEKPRYSPHYATYWSGSFVISKRAKRGQSSDKVRRGDPDSWWTGYADNKTRSTWLKAYAAERLPKLFEIVMIQHKPCTKCGGKGQVKQMSLKGLKALGGAHEWWELCPRCYGAKEDRSVAYR